MARFLTEFAQRSPEWFEARRGIPTASSFRRVITAKEGRLSTSHVGYIGELIDEIVRPGEQVSWGGNEHTERGVELEAQARKWFELRTGYSVGEVGLILTDDGRAGCSPDGVVLGKVLSKPLAGLEIKAPDGKTHVEYMLGGVLPDEYRQQVHGSMAVSGLDKWWFLSYCPGYKPFLIEVKRDSYTALVEKAIKQFVVALELAKSHIIDGYDTKLKSLGETA